MSLYGLGNGYQKLVDDTDNTVIASALLSVAEGKRIIGRAVARMPVVRKAMRKGMVIVCKGTTNTYVAEELLGEKITRGSFVLGRIYPNENAVRLPSVKQMDELVLIDGVAAEDISLEKAVTMLSPGDVVIKGANLLDYRNKLAGINIGSPTAGTAGVIMPYVIARRVNLVIPIGLEKLIAGNLSEIAERLNRSTERLKDTPALWPVSGHIVTEIEAIRQFADVDVYESACGGIGGQEGGRWLVVEGQKHQVLKAMKAIEDVYGEEPFAK